MSRWYYMPDKRLLLGPVTSEQLRQLALLGAIRPENLVMREGDGRWVTASKVRGLFSGSAAPRSQKATPDSIVPRDDQEAEPESQDARGPGTGRRMWPVIVLAGSLALVLVLCSGAGLVGVMFVGWLNNRNDPVANGPEKPPGPATTEAGFTTVDLASVYEAYRGNEAAADAAYLNKRVQFTFRPWAIDKDSSGSYFAWDNIFGLDDSNTRGKHRKCYLRANQAAALGNFNHGQVLSVRGVCAGKAGMISTYYPGFNGADGFYKSNPVIEFRDCELVK